MRFFGSFSAQLFILNNYFFKFLVLFHSIKINFLNYNDKYHGVLCFLNTESLSKYCIFKLLLTCTLF